MLILLSFLIILFGVILSILFGLQKASPNNHSEQLSISQKVAILIAVRNESENLPVLFQSLRELIPPTHNFEIWFGNDHSEDDSENLIREFCSRQTNAKYLIINKNLPGIYAKQNVLAQLIQAVPDADYYLVTDADIVHNPNWAVELVNAMQKQQLGVVSGITIVNGRSFFTKLQGLDWLFSASFLKFFADRNIPITAIGNNMGFSRAAYQKTGGYEKLPFSITEDFLLFSAILKHGFRHGIVFNAASTNISAPAKDLSTWFRQRKRWLTGGLAAPWYAHALIVLFVLSNIASLIILLLYLNSFTITILIMKIAAEVAWLTKNAMIIRQQNLLRYIPFYYLYGLFSAIFLPLYFILPGKIDWKGRKL